jgi:PAS domain S-box-containing protein
MKVMIIEEEPGEREMVMAVLRKEFPNTEFISPAGHAPHPEAERLRKEVESREQHYRSLADALPLIVWTARPDGSVDYLNHRWYEYTGLDFERSRGWGWLAAVHPDEQDHSIDRWLDAVRVGRPHDIQFRLRRAGDLAWRAHIGRAAPLRDENGRIVKWIGAYTDIEEERRAAEALRLTHRVESIGMLAGGIAHDFNNLLTGVLGNASLAMMELDDGNPAAARRLVQEITRASERAADLVRQLLAYSGKGRFYLQPVHLSEAVRDISVLLRSTVHRKVELKFELEPSLPLFMADMAQLHQLVMNLVINAAEAIDHARGGAVAITTGVVHLNEPLRQLEYGQMALPEGSYLFLDVSDNGCGMTPEVRSRICEPFFTTRFTGRGLGMAAALGIVRGHRGAIAVESEPGKGSRFRAYFPVEEAKAAATGAAGQGQSDLYGSGLVLVADDEEIVRRITRSALERYGYDVIVAENGAAAFDLFRERPGEISLVFVDMTMPVMSGEELLAAIREIDTAVPVIATSGHNEVVALQKFAGYGVDAFLQKPYSSRQLAETVKAVLSRSSAVRSGASF